MQQATAKLSDITDANALREMVSAEYNKLRAEEEILELEMKNLGKDNFFKKVEKAKKKGQESNTSYGQFLMQRCINPAAEML
jgi:cell division protein FtsB